MLYLSFTTHLPGNVLFVVLSEFAIEKNFTTCTMKVIQVGVAGLHNNETIQGINIPLTIVLAYVGRSGVGYVCM